MSRYFALQTWVGSHENEPDYNGNQCGSRNVRSVEAIPLYDIYGKANVNAFSEEAIATKRKPKVKRSAFEQVCLADSRYNRLQSLLEALEQEHEDGKISWEDFIYARKQLEPRLERAWRQISKARNWIEEEEENYSSSESLQYAKENTYKNDDSDQGHTLTWVDTLSPDNCFKKPIEKALQAARLLVVWQQKARNYIKR